MARFSDFVNSTYLRQLIKYAIVGGLGTLIDFIIFESLWRNFVFLENNLGYAKAIAFIVAVVSNYIFNRRWTFRDRSKAVGRQFVKFFIVAAIGFVLAIAFIELYTKTFGIYPTYANLLTSATVVVWNFLGSKYFAFNSSKNIDQKSAPV